MQRSSRKCSFCGKPQGEVRLVAGPGDVAICHLCIALCQEILSHPEGPLEPPVPAPPGVKRSAWATERKST